MLDRRVLSNIQRTSVPDHRRRSFPGSIILELFIYTTVHKAHYIVLLSGDSGPNKLISKKGHVIIIMLLKILWVIGWCVYFS